MTLEAATSNAKDDLNLMKWCRTHFIEVSVLTVFASFVGLVWVFFVGWFGGFFWLIFLFI